MADLDEIFQQLKALLKPHEQHLVLKADAPGDYSLDTHRVRKDGYAEWFGGAQIKKNYVSYHLMPVYTHPELLQGVSPELKKRMQGKSCFNFKRLDESLLAELAELTRRGAERVKNQP